MWSGKVLGGLVGGMVGGPVGLGVGAAIGHYLVDGKDEGFTILHLEWAHHAFTAAGPGVRLTPVWTAKGHAGRECRVRLQAAGLRQQASVVPDEDEETSALPEFFVPYAGFDGRARVSVGARSADFEVELPTEVRRLGSSGPARLVMALVACARAGGRELSKDDVRFIRETFTSSMPLEEDGRAWLRAWLRVLRDAELPRLAPDRVAARVERHLEQESLRLDALLLWLMRGAREAWPGAAQERWIARFAEALRCDAARLGALWDELDGPAADEAWARSVLGVGTDASEDEAKAAWRRLAQEHHPDHADPGEITEATRRMAEINAAWRILRG